MSYIDEITLIMIGKKLAVEQVNFRDSICKPMNELYSSGYLDRSQFILFGNVVGTLRFSHYIPEEKLTEHIIRLRQFYDVGFYEATYNVAKQVFYFNFLEDSKAIIRVFALEDYCKLDTNMQMENYNFGVLYIKQENEFYKVDSENAFIYIPDKCEALVFKNEPAPIAVKPATMNELYQEEISVA